jgi:hypothetical protein
MAKRRQFYGSWYLRQSDGVFVNYKTGTLAKGDPRTGPRRVFAKFKVRRTRTQLKKELRLKSFRKFDRGPKRKLKRARGRVKLRPNPRRRNRGS